MGSLFEDEEEDSAIPPEWFFMADYQGWLGGTSQPPANICQPFGLAEAGRVALKRPHSRR